MDKRRFVRLETLLEVVHRKESHPSSATLTLTTNISQGGICFIDCDEINNFHLADLINLDIFFPYDDIPIKTQGKVAWIRNHDLKGKNGRNKFDMGIEFLEIKEEDKKRIQEHIKNKLSEKR